MEITNLRLNVSFYEDTQDLTDEEFGRLVRYGFGCVVGEADTVALTGAEKVFARQVRRYVEEDNERYKEIVEKKRNAANARWNSNDAHGCTSMQMHADASGALQTDANDANTKTKTNIEKEKGLLRNPKEKESDFALFWKAYPKKVGKASAEKAFKKVTVSVDVLTEAIEKQKKSASWQRDGGQYIPYPATWLNGKRWEDEVDMGRMNGRVHLDISDPHSYDGEDDESGRLFDW